MMDNLNGRQLNWPWARQQLSRNERGTATDATLAPLSRAQERLWFLEQLAPSVPVYNLNVALRLHGVVDQAILQEAINELANRHAPLRTTFAAVDGIPVQIIAPNLTLKVELADLRLIVPGAQQAQVEKLLAAQFQYHFNLAHGPLLRALLVQLEDDEFVLSLTAHRIILDDGSVSILCEELGALYQDELDGEERLGPLPFEYAEYCVQQRQWLEGDQAEAELTFWREQLGALSTLQLFTDHARPAVQTFQGKSQSGTLPGVLVARLSALADHEGTSLKIVFLTAFQTLLHRYTAQDDICVGFPVSGRHTAGAESIIGLFENNLVLRTDFSGDPTAREVLARVRQGVAAAEGHQTLPFERLVEDLAHERDLSRTPLFQVMFRSGALVTPFGLGDVRAEPLDFDPGTARFDLTMSVVPAGEDWKYTVTYNTALFDSGTIARMLGHYRVLLEAIATDAEQAVAVLPLLTTDEERELVIDWNRTQVDFPQDRSYQQLFEAQVALTPDAPAAQHNGEQLSYQQLNARANGWAAYLVEQGVGPDTVVAILADRGLDFLTSILAVFKAGGAYLPLDPQHPALRIRQILEQSQARLVIVADDHMPMAAQALEGFAASKPAVSSLGRLGQIRRRSENLTARNKPGDLAYVIYTSGSTGAPKGAMVEQVGMVNHLYAKVNDLKLQSSDIVAQNASQCFDISVWQFLAGLLVGGETCIFGDEVTYDPPQLLDQIQEKKITVLEIVPSVLRFMVDEIESRAGSRPTLSALRWLIPTGEALPPKLCRRWLELYPDIHVVNAYGPTECSDDVTHCFIDRPPALNVVNMPVGRPIQNMRMYILTDNLQVTPIGVAGELHVGGIGVGRGYLGRPDLTADRFIRDPFSQEPGARLYKTGDLARYLPDGKIEYLGRIDYQVKVRGFRIELAEIEAAIGQHPNIRESVVMAREDSPGDKRLVAYYVAKQPRAPSGSELRRWLKEKLPEYMVPAAFVTLDAMPLTPNGKINRKALPVPPPSRPELDKGFVPPRDALELQLAQLWEEVLGVKPIGTQDNFFELGGHSLLAVRLFGEIQRRMGRKLQLAALFEAPTVEQLANLLRQKAAGTPHASLVPVQPEGTKPPVFFVHPIGGDILGYANVARLLGPDQPFYGLRARGLDGVHPPDGTVPEMAAHYIQEIMTVEPDGPYLIGGYSFGGTVAFEMARQLIEMDKKVSLLAIIDDGPPNYEQSFKWTLSSVVGFVRNLPYWLVDDLLQGSAGQILNRVTRKLKRSIKQIGNRLDPSDITTFEPDFEDVVDVSSIPEHYRKVWKANYEAVTCYEPKRYPGKITLLRVRAQPLFSTHDHEMGWGPYAEDGVEVRMIAGFHEKVLVEPNVQVLAAQLDEVLQLALATHPKLNAAYTILPLSQNAGVAVD